MIESRRTKEVSPRRIVVTNFDSVEQAQCWLTDGAEKATDTYLAILRTAVLLGLEVVVDRNQLLDGVFFLSLGPERIATQLGLEPDADLPLTMTGASGEAQGPELKVPRPRGRDSSGETFSLALQREQVRSPGFLPTSSALGAIVGAIEANPWLVPEPSGEWYPGCGLTDRLHPLRRGEHQQGIELIEATQDRWFEAALRGRIGVDQWNGMTSMDMALGQRRKHLKRACGAYIRPSDLALHILSQQSTRRADIVEAISEWAMSRPETTDNQKRHALTLWTRAYYQAIAWSEDAMLVSFDKTLSEGAEPGLRTASLDEMRFREARRFGLVVPPRTAVQRWQERRLMRIRTLESIRVNGTIVDDMRVIGPEMYRQLMRASQDVLRSLVDERDPAAMYDLALACRRAVDLGPSHRRRQITAGIRATTMTLFAIGVVALTLMGEFWTLSTSEKWFAVCGAAVLGLLSSLPWDDLAEGLALRRGSMTATLDLGNHE